MERIASFNWPLFYSSRECVRVYVCVYVCVAIGDSLCVQMVVCASVKYRVKRERAKGRREGEGNRSRETCKGE